MNDISLAYIVTLIGEIGVIAGLVIPIWTKVLKIANGTKCQLRSEMLRIYYHNRENRTIRQYEFENFMILYQEYKALKGNSFVDKIHKEVETWEVLT